MKNISKDLEKEQLNEHRLTKRWLLYSLLGHMVFALFYLIKLPSRSKTVESIEAELVMSTNLGKAKKSTDTEKSQVEKNTLPQLTKNLMIKQERPKDGIAILSKEKEKEREKIRRMKLKELRKKAIAKEELLKRIAREKARKEKAFARKERLRLAQDLEKLRSMNNEMETIGTGVSGDYRGIAKSWIERHYEIPDTYHIPIEGVEVVLLVFVNAQGDVTNIKVKKPSSSPLFNRIAVQTVRKSSPLPKPPAEVVGKYISLTFTPEKL